MEARLEPCVRRCRLLVSGLVLPLGVVSALVAQAPSSTAQAPVPTVPVPAPPKRPWSDKAALSYVSVGGNADSQSLGFSNEFKYAWASSAIIFNLGGVRVATTTTDRAAFGPDLGSVTILENRVTKTSTETYYANIRYDHNITERLRWFGSAGWERNVPAGLQARYTGLVGLGYWAVKQDRTKLFVDLGAGYTQETLVFSPTGMDNRFATFRLATKFEKKLFATSAFSSELNMSDSLRDSQNYLAVWRNAFLTNLNAKLALKVGYDVTYKNKPASIGVNVVQTPIGTPPVVLGQVAVPLKKTDTVFTTSLVITF
jgi:putative salt-induced outer membrane protein YdiY